MRQECIKVASAFLGRDLKTSETRGIEDRVNLAMRLLQQQDPDTWRTLSAADRVRKGSEMAAQQMLADVKKQQQRVALTIAAHDRIQNFLDTRKYKEPGDRLQAVSELLDFDTKGGGFTSAASYTHALQDQTFGHLIPLFESVRPHFFGLFENRAGVRALIKELWGEDSGNATAKGGAVIWKKQMDELRDRYNAAGGDIGKLDEWHYPQNHARERIGAAGVEKWISDTMPLLDRSKYMNLDGTRMDDKAVHSFMEHAYDTLITDGMNKMPEGPQRGYGLIANRHSGSRQIFFKDADSYLHYQGEYGDKGLWSVMTGHVRSVARDTALAEVLGPNPDHVFASFNDRAHLAEMRDHPTDSSKLTAMKAFNKALFDYVSGRQEVVNQKLADRFQAFRNLQTWAKLGKVMITALTDEGGMAATAFANKVPWTGAFYREMRTLNPLDHTDRRIAEQNALGINSLVGGLNKFAMEEFGQSWTAKLAATTLRMGTAERMWDSRRQGLGSMLMSYAGHITREVEHFADINQEDHGQLARKGVTEENWQVWRAAQPEDWGAGAHTVLTHKSIAEIPDEKLDAAIAPRLEGLRQEADRQVEALRGKDAQDQTWLADRSAELSEWLKRQQASIDKRIARLGDNASAETRALSVKLSKLSEDVEYAASYWKGGAGADAPGIDRGQKVGFYGKSLLRGLGVQEGKAVERMRQIQRDVRQVSTDMKRQSKEITEQVAERYEKRQEDLNAFAQRVADRAGRRAQVAERISSDLKPGLEQARATARRQASTVLMAHVLEEAGMGAMDTGPRQRVMMSFGTKKGTMGGELTRSAMLFKSFPVSMMSKHWARASTMPTAGGKWAYIARLAVGTTIASSIGLELRALLAGQNPRDANPKNGWRFWGEAILRGGGLGFYGDFLYDELNSHDNTLIPALAGPLGTTAEDIWNLTGGAFFKHQKGKRTDEAANLIRFARSNIGGLNMWYTQAAMDHLLWNSMQDAASPGYLARMQSKAYTQRGTTYFWDPHSTLPKVGPDLQQAWQPTKSGSSSGVASLVPETVRRFGERIAGDNPSIP